MKLATLSGCSAPKSRANSQPVRKPDSHLTENRIANLLLLYTYRIRQPFAITTLVRCSATCNHPRMNRRTFAVSALASVALLTACDTDQKPSATATLLNSGDVQDALKSLRAAIGELQSAVGGFDSGDDWKEVVPQVKGAADDVESSFSKIQEALGASS